MDQGSEAMDQNKPSSLDLDFLGYFISDGKLAHSVLTVDPGPHPTNSSSLQLITRLLFDQREVRFEF